MSVSLPRAASRAWPYLCFWIVWAGALLHFWWAFLFTLQALKITSGVSDSTPVRGVIRGMDQLGLNHVGFLICGLVLSGVLALWVTTTERRNLRTILALLPQQIFLLMSAIASIRAMFEGHYADGVTRPFGFISGDQAGTIVMALVYSVAIITFHSWRSKYAWKRLGDESSKERDA